MFRLILRNAPQITITNEAAKSVHIKFEVLPVNTFKSYVLEIRNPKKNRVIIIMVITITHIEIFASLVLVFSFMFY
jgi:hypothetical protein